MYENQSETIPKEKNSEIDLPKVLWDRSFKMSEMIV